MNKDSFLYVVIFTFLAAFIFVFVIALADNATAFRVEENQELATAKAYFNAVGATDESDDDTVLDAFRLVFGSVEGGEIERTSALVETMLVKQFSGQGLWGTITGVLAVNADVTRIIGLDIISHAETPGLGGRIEEDWFKDQFRGERIGEEGIVVRKGEGGVDSDPDNAAVDGVTGASLTSAAMEIIINKEIGALRKEASR